jgi:hypothetical protein
LKNSICFFFGSVEEELTGVVWNVDFLLMLLNDVLVGNVDANLVQSCSQCHFHVVWHVLLWSAKWTEVDACHLQDTLLGIVSWCDCGPGVDNLNSLSLVLLSLLDIFFLH